MNERIDSSVVNSLVSDERYDLFLRGDRDEFVEEVFRRVYGLVPDGLKFEMEYIMSGEVFDELDMIDLGLDSEAVLREKDMILSRFDEMSGRVVNCLLDMAVDVDLIVFFMNCVSFIYDMAEAGIDMKMGRLNSSIVEE